MSKNLLIGLGIVGILVIVGAAGYMMRPTADASAPIEAIPVDPDESSIDEAADTEAEPVQEDSAGMAVPGETSVDEMIVVEEPEVTEETEAVGSATAQEVVFTIVQEESEVRFTLGEVLSGVPTTVIGSTDQVAGEIAINPDAPATSRVGMVLVNARTLATDNNFRNRAINNEILETDEFEFIRFTPTTIEGFPENPAVGETLDFQISGDLTIRDITNEVTFDVTVTVVSETRLEGSASTMVARETYDLRIPSVPRVADVDEEVLVEIDFVAVAQ